MIPCVQDKGVNLFVTTADQRYLLGDGPFIRTHFPSNMKRFKANGDIQNWNEEDLKRELMRFERGKTGNRTFVLYGAAGSGKSELIRWLWREMRMTEREPFVLRISRTELDPVQIIHKILTQFNLPGLDDSVLSQWEELRKKPVSLANHLVWSSLGTILPSDEEIIPLSYKLRPIIEKNLRISLSGTDYSGSDCGMELISLEELEELAQQCFIPTDVDMEQVRFLMLRELEHSVMGGVNFVDTLRTISAQVERISGMRPMLLVDDLVQSLNIYATDLLDYFVTMEEGNWDIVLGLTPASFESSQRGRDILNRINHLDTFNDRIIKLWMSDEQGNNSFVICEENCHLFAEKYLLEYKRINGFQCDQACGFYSYCSKLESIETTPGLMPFNANLLRRVYRSLPRGKGKPRYFIRELGEILSKMAQQDLVGALSNSFLRELAVDHPDPLVRLVIESYAPDDIKSKGRFRIRARDLNYFSDSLAYEDEVIDVNVTSLISYKSQASEQIGILSTGEVDPGKMAIREWLDEKTINKELLKGLRLGIAHLLREALQPTEIMPNFTSRQSSIIKWEETQEGSKIPLALEGIDSFEGINVNRDIGHLAYNMNYLHLRRGKAKEAAVEFALQNQYIYSLLLKTGKYKNSLLVELERELGMAMDELSYHLFRVILEMGHGVNDIPLPLWEEYQLKGKLYPQQIRNIQVFLGDEEAELTCALFKDWFMLRENVYDGMRLKLFGQRFKRINSIEIIEHLDSSRINEHFQIGGTPFSHYIARIQASLKQMKNVLDMSETGEVIGVFINIMGLLREMQHPVVHTDISSILAYIASSLQFEEILVPEWQTCNKLLARLDKTFKRYLNKEGVVELKSPIEYHRLLLLLGTLENDLVYRQMLSINDFIFNSQKNLELKYWEFKNQVDQIGVSGYFDWMDATSWDIKSNIDFDHMEKLVISIRRLLQDRQRLKVLEISLPYVNQDLAQNVHMTEKMLLQLENLNLPGWFMVKVQDIITRCHDYRLAIEDLSDTELDANATRHSISQLASNYSDLSNDGLELSLRELIMDWQSYISKYKQIMSIFKIEVFVPVIKKGIEDVTISNDGGVNNSTVMLAEHLVQLISNACGNLPLLGDFVQTEIDEKVHQYLPVIDLLMENSSPEVEVNLKTLSMLSLFLNDFSGFENALRARLYLK